MPRLRRAARQRREQPQLAAGFWEWVRGAKTFNELAEENKWDWLVLEARLDRFESSADFWNPVRQAVADGTIKVTKEKEHYLSDQPLIGPPRNGTKTRNRSPDR